uniref:Release factor glutamine methyltransferase n=1 Tax=Candidatus Kentrum sp. DK TaxID=2126562 RepID=A0A450S2T2_9GAMM|nr:MAG: [protein release factor]-glutamine N5-methyltransferase [Candidatus Kentron sp. DK]
MTARPPAREGPSPLPSPPTDTTLGAALRVAIRALTPHSPSPRADAEILLGHVLGKPRHWPYVWRDKPIADPVLGQFRDLVTRRATGQPIAWLTGRRAFWTLDLRVTPDVLIPRPDTETLVEVALALIPEDASWRIADLGTGTGPVALALARERPGCRITATDISAAALAVASRNATEHRVENVTFRAGDWFAALEASSPAPPDAPPSPGRGTSGAPDPIPPYSLILSNPPYVAADDPHLARGDVRFEPALALIGGPDGLDAIHHIARHARHYLAPGGWLALEHGYDQGARVRTLLEGFGYRGITTRRDDGGQERVTWAAWGEA